ncbi:hypothetical protein MMYC01_201899 [Madurella mycetomatis]|uniref:Uncharacterized protein n=1 Tax=Madurella mycetomatis TaxID=100816 RepID=A0A175WBI7_9PEZI|nr:hypothetical protein MMYC01_201899 [Madurella mycetomatis]
MAARGFKYLWVVLLAFLIRAGAACTSYGVDYSNNGAYYIDGSSNEYFTFITVFQGCTQETIHPILVSPENHQYACSSIRTTPAGVQVTSTCGIPFSAMSSGDWKIVIAGNQISSQRIIKLTVGVPQTTWVTATPTVVVGYTTTARDQTVLTTLVQTHTLIVVPRTVTAPCNGATRTVTVYPQTPTVVVTSTVIRTATDGQVTRYWTTTVSETASCHYPSSWSPSTNPPAPTASWCPGRGGCDPFWETGGGSGGGGGGGWGWWTRWTGNADPTAPDRRDVAATAATAAAAAVAAVTSTYTQTTYTVTSTLVTTIAGRTTTELVLRTTTTTVTPPPSTVCAGGRPGATATVTRGYPAPVTETDIFYSTTHLSGTVWVGQTQFTTVTNSASATACWRAGGWYG